MKYFIGTILIILLVTALPNNAWAALININTANATQLDTLPEIGPALAQKIIDYRNLNGPFETIEEIMQVSGIKEATFAKLKDFITVASESVTSQTESEAEAETVETDDEEEVVEVANNSGPISAHAGQISLSHSSEKLTWEISAGRSRRVLVNMPIVLEAKTVKGEPKEIKSFSWSFGDGESFRGRDAVHVYRYPGTYQVVVNGRADGDQVAVARTKVVVEKPSVNIRWSPDGTHAVQLKNNNSLEINLGGFRLGNASTTILTIPNDTILVGGGEITIPLPGGQLYSRAQVGDVSIFDSLGNEVAREQSAQPVTAALPPALLPEPVLELEPVVPELATSTFDENIIELGEPKTGWWQLLLNWLQS
jgi:competence ComEA-like helix-hairpin-helix protein